ncbi:MAG TPA: MFS transporter [Anaerolineales bacterium]|jgi:maltose/moltooligosaccharide transporter|nr:MFS transporter [Anaerolineales bacterium]
MKFNYGKTFLLGFGFLGISIIWPIFNQFIPIFLQAGNPDFERQLLSEGRAIPDIVGFGLAPSLALFIMTWDNIINMFVQPWVGAKSDQTWNRFGRRKPWIVAGAPIALLAFVFIPVAQTILAMAVFILITNFGMALFRSPTVAWLGDLFEPDDRSKANGIINLMGGIGGLLAYFGGGILFNNFGRVAPFVAGASVMVVALVIVLIFVKEPEQIKNQEKVENAGVLDNLKIVFANPDKSGLFVLLGILFWFMAFNALETGLSSFAVFTLGMQAGTASIYTGLVTITFILFAVPAGFFGTRFGRGSVIRVGLTGLAILTLLGYLFIQSTLTFAIILILVGSFWAMVNVNSLPLVYDHGDEARIGAFTGLYYLSSQLAAVLGPTLGGVLVDVMGNQYRWLWLFSAVFMSIALVMMFRVQQRDSSLKMEST